MSKLFDFSSLAMIPTAVKDGKLYSIRPTDGSGDFTFSRGSNLAATRVDVNGLIEKGRENLAQQSNSFNNWTNYLTTETSGQADRSGGTSAWLLEKIGASGSIYRTPSPSGVATFSAYVKAGTLNWVRLDFVGGGSKSYFDLQNGVVGSVTGSPIDSSIEDVGNGWYRCSLTTTSTGSGIGVIPAEGDGSISGTSGNIYIQDAQLEQGLVATDYIETGASTAQAGILEDLPRLDYSGGASCPSLLLEGSRTNLIDYSEWFGSATWTKQTNITITDNTTDVLSPEGKYNAAKIVSGDATKGFFDNTKSSTANSVRSIYLRGAVGGETLLLKDISGFGGIESITLSADWVRYELATTNTGDTYRGLFVDNISVGTIYAYGAQWEEGSYATSYIPTMGVSASRAQDQAASTGLTSTLNSSEGVLYAELKWTELATTIYLSLSDGSNSNGVLIYRTAENNIRMLVRVGGVTQASFIVTEDTNEYVKVAAKYNTNDFAIWVNGTERNTDTSGSTFSANTLNKIGFDAGLTGGFSGSVKQIIYFPTALTDSELASLTTI
jgi:hypothetical protein